MRLEYIGYELSMKILLAAMFQRGHVIPCQTRLLSESEGKEYKYEKGADLERKTKWKLEMI